MTLTEALYEATEIRCVPWAGAFAFDCEHEDWNPRAFTEKRYGPNRFEHRDIERHSIEPRFKVFLFADADLLFDIHVKWWYCQHKKRLAYAWHPAVEINIEVFGQKAALPERCAGFGMKLTGGREWVVIWKCPLCSDYTRESPSIDAFMEIRNHLRREHLPELIQFNDDMRVCAGVGLEASR